MRQDSQSSFWYTLSGIPAGVMLMAAPDYIPFLKNFPGMFFWTGLILTILFVFRAVVIARRNEPLASQTGHRRRMIALTGMVLCAFGFVGFAAMYFWPDEERRPAAKAVSSPVTFDFEPRYPWIVPPERRPGYPSYAVVIGVYANQRLNDAQAFVVNFQKWEHDKWSEPLNNFIKTQLAWPAMEKSFSSRNLVDKP